MLRLSSVFLFILLAIGAFSQNERLITQLKKDLNKANEADSYPILEKLAWEYRASHPDSGIYFGQKAYLLGLKLKRKDLARVINYTGLSFYHKGNSLEAYDYFVLAQKTAELSRDSLQLAHAANNLGRLFMDQNQLEKSLAYLTQGKNIFRKINDLSGLAYSYQSLASYAKIAKNITEAENNYHKAYEIRKQAGQPGEVVSSIIQLGKFYEEINQLDKALTYFHLADSADRAINDALFLAEIKIHTADCFLKRNELAKADVLAKEGLAKIESSGNLRLLPEAYLVMGQIKFNEGNLENAKNYFTLMLKVSTMRKDLNARMEAYFQLWQTYKRQNDRFGEFDSYTQYMQLKDSVRSLELSQQEARIKFETELEKREKENEILKLKSQRKSALLAVMILITMIALIILYVQLKYRRKILRINHLLEDRNHEIKKVNTLLEEKNGMLEDHMHTLVELSKNRSIAVGNLGHAAKDIVYITSRKLSISQVSIWLYDEAKQCIETIACYQYDKDCYPDKVTLRFEDAPAYFEAIRKERMITANDARQHPSTREFTNSYFLPNDIYSLLDVTFFLDGKLKGLMCCEQQKEIRHWSAEDKIFISSMADVISLAFRSSQRLEYEMHIKDQHRKIAQMNEDLEERVKQRTEELEEQNKRLIEYAFINSHQLRGPVSRILGLINLAEQDKSLKEAQILNLLRVSGNELDEVVKKINDALTDGHPLSKKDFK